MLTIFIFYEGIPYTWFLGFPFCKRKCVLFAPENFELNILVIRTPILKIRHLKVNKICMRLCTHIWDKYPHPSNVFRKSCIVYIKKINNMLTYNICLSSLNM